jgi:hypothetical protein
MDDQKKTSEQPYAVWYYEKSGARKGPVTEVKIIDLLQKEELSGTTLVWKNGMPDWQRINETGFNHFTQSPPPVSPSAVNNSLVWWLAFMPIAGAFTEFLVANAFGVASASLWFITVLLNVLLCIIDEKRLKRAGYKIKSLGSSLLVPVYLFRRASLLKQKNVYAVIWCVTFAVMLLLPANNLQRKDYVQTVKTGYLQSYADSTVGDLVDGYFANSQWQTIKADDGSYYVNITGDITYNGNQATVLLQYKMKDETAFEFQALEIDGVPQNIQVYSNMIASMYDEYKNKHP